MIGGPQRFGSFTLRAKELLKRFVVKVAPLGVQRKLRRRHVVRQVLKDQTPLEREAQALKFLIAPGNSVADVGANVGVYTRQLSSLVGVSGRVYSFEPVSENLEILEDVVRLARLANVTTFHAALGSNAGHCEVVVPDRGDFTGYYWAHIAEPGEAGKREVVEVLTFDMLWKKKMIGDIDFIKCDVEGGELEVMRGAVELMRARHPGWLLEVSRKTSREVFEFFNALGYQSLIYNNGFERTMTYRDHQSSNYFFLYPGSRQLQATS